MTAIKIELVQREPFEPPVQKTAFIFINDVKYLFRACGDTLVLGFANNNSGVENGKINPTVQRFTTRDFSVIDRLKQAGAELVEVQLATCLSDPRVNGIAAFVNRGAVKGVRKMPRVYAHLVIEFNDGKSIIAVKRPEELRHLLTP